MRFSLPAKRYLSRHHLPSSRYDPPLSHSRYGLPLRWAARIALSVRGIWGQQVLSDSFLPPMLPPVAPGCQWTTPDGLERGLRVKKAAKACIPGRLRTAQNRDLVAKGGIEPPTQGFVPVSVRFARFCARRNPQL